MGVVTWIWWNGRGCDWMVVGGFIGWGVSVSASSSRRSGSSTGIRIVSRLSCRRYCYYWSCCRVIAIVIGTGGDGCFGTAFHYGYCWYDDFVTSNNFAACSYSQNQTPPNHPYCPIHPSSSFPSYVLPASSPLYSPPSFHLPFPPSPPA